MAVKIQVKIFGLWCCVVLWKGTNISGDPSRSSETFLSYHNTTHCHSPEDLKVGKSIQNTWSTFIFKWCNSEPRMCGYNRSKQLV